MFDEMYELAIKIKYNLKVMFFRGLMRLRRLNYNDACRLIHS